MAWRALQNLARLRLIVVFEIIPGNEVGVLEPAFFCREVAAKRQHEVLE